MAEIDESPSSDELWREIDGYPYEVSNLGRVRNLKGQAVVGTLKRNGYRHVSLSRQGNRRSFYVHRLVYEAFVGPIPEGYVVHHKNHERDDNRLVNLEAMSASDNSRHSALNMMLIRHGKIKCTLETVRQIRRLGTLGKSHREIAEVCNVSKSTVGAILRGQAWKNIR